MATLLYKIGRFSYRRRLVVLGLWLVLMALAGTGAATLSGKMSNSFDIPGTESQKAISRLADRFPDAHVGGATAQVVFVAPSGSTLTTSANRAAVEQTVTGLKGTPKVVAVTDPYRTRALSADGRYALVQVSYTAPSGDVTTADRKALLNTLDTGRAAGLTVEAGGTALGVQAEQSTTQLTGLVVAALVLVITFGSLLAAGLPLLTALVGVGAGLSAVAIASGFVDVNANSTVLALMLGLAVGIDYALFIVSRFRQEAREHGAGPEAAGRAVGRAGSAVVFAGLTVVIALAGLSVVGIPVLRSMGLAAAATVALAVLVAVTLLPALLGFAGGRVARGRSGLFPRRPASGPDDTRTAVAMGERWARFVTRFRIPVLIVALGGLLTVALPLSQLRLALPDDGTYPAASTQRKAYDLIREGFGPGFNGPLTVVVDADGNVRAGAARVATAIQVLPDVVAVGAPRLGADGETALLTVIPKSGPTDQATTDLVNAIRDEEAALRRSTGADVAVTGTTALNIDVSRKIGDALLPYLAIIVGLAVLLLMLAFRSVLIPLKATLGFLLSIGATFGAVVAVFQWGWLGSVFGVHETGPIVNLLPILLVGILFGLAMDYQVFLVSRMREAHVRGDAPVQAVVAGFRTNARVVTAAAVIMAGVFSGFILSDQVLVKSIGFALAFGVLVDAFVVRMTIVPALMSLLGPAAWWLPRGLDRILPKVDIEGRGLAARPAVSEPVRPESEPESESETESEFRDGQAIESRDHAGR
ncbi:MMPL family transporter [Streptomyces sp. NPDC002588]|uniref:MMPL family transporter n=1 Tax=Streptomyces sp. NPDC002588 TaxID=3154419 RepID=UPI00332535B7